MKCIGCGAKITDIKRMCDKCAAQMLSRLVEEEKKEDEKSAGEDVLPAGAPKGVVTHWNPTKKFS